MDGCLAAEVQWDQQAGYGRQGCPGQLPHLGTVLIVHVGSVLGLKKHAKGMMQGSFFKDPGI